MLSQTRIAQNTDQSSGDISWINTGNAIDDNDTTYAEIDATQAGDVRAILLTNFGFSIPNNAILRGIRFDPNVGWSGPVGFGWIEALGVEGETPILQSGEASFVPFSIGDDDDLLPAILGTLTPAIINNQNFGISLKVWATPTDTEGGVGTVTESPITVYYDVPPPSQSIII